MSDGWRGLVVWLRAQLAGVRLSRSIARYERAANELDRAVREVLER